jgi:hypothetical protein
MKVSSMDGEFSKLIKMLENPKNVRNEKCKVEKRKIEEMNQFVL